MSCPLSLFLGDQMKFRQIGSSKVNNSEALAGVNAPSSRRGDQTKVVVWLDMVSFVPSFLSQRVFSGYL